MKSPESDRRTAGNQEPGTPEPSPGTAQLTTERATIENCNCLPAMAFPPATQRLQDNTTKCSQFVYVISRRPRPDRLQFSGKLAKEGVPTCRGQKPQNRASLQDNLLPRGWRDWWKHRISAAFNETGLPETQRHKEAVAVAARAV